MLKPLSSLTLTDFFYIMLANEYLAVRSFFEPLGILQDVFNNAAFWDERLKDYRPEEYSITQFEAHRYLDALACGDDKNGYYLYDSIEALRCDTNTYEYYPFEVGLDYATNKGREMALCYENHVFGTCAVFVLCSDVFDELAERAEKWTAKNFQRYCYKHASSLPQLTPYVDKAIAAGLVTDTGNGYTWNGTNALCAYFAEKCNEVLQLSNTQGRTNWKPFCALFGLTQKQLQYGKQAYRALGLDGPERYKEVDALFAS